MFPRLSCFWADCGRNTAARRATDELLRSRNAGWWGWHLGLFLRYNRARFCPLGVLLRCAEGEIILESVIYSAQFNSLVLDKIPCWLVTTKP